MEVVRVREKKDGSQEVALKRTDGKQFFNAFPTIELTSPMLLSSGELRERVDSQRPVVKINFTAG
ncbi:MAG: hypothetical protein U5K51_08600 [Flavobacteriaceae bacterium]|nr:hypothetical protein [Flavobacteriaceae bacterium]